MRNSNLSFNNKTKNSFLKELMEWVGTFSVAILVSLLIIGNVFTMTRIEGRSMEPTLFDGERGINYRLGYRFNSPKVGDIVVINKIEPKKGIIANTIEAGKDILEKISNTVTKKQRVKYIVKRVIGVPGDVIDIRDGKVYVNTKELEESYIKGQTFADSSLEYPLIVPDKKFIVLGDNRENSLDSRMIGLIDYYQITGKFKIRLSPLKRFGKVE